MRTFTVADNENLVGRIQSACDRLVYIAPGVFEPVASALVEAIQQRRVKNLRVVVDADEEACRLGFGEIKALRKLKDAAEQHRFMLCHQPSLRVGLLLSDNDILFWSPTPLLVEDQPHSAQKPNAIDLCGGNIEKLCNAVGAGENDAAELEQEIGLDPLPEERLQTAEKALEANPPKKFDLARKERVFSSVLEFVEMKLSDYQMSKKKLPIPSELLALSEDEDTQKRWRNQFAVFEHHDCMVELDYLDKKQKVDEAFLEAERKRLDKQYLVAIPGYGKVITLRFKSEFQKEVAAFEKMLEAYAKGISASVTEHIAGMVKKLADDLLPRFLEKPPMEFQKTLFDDESPKNRARNHIISRLESATRKIEQHVSPKLRVVYKGITYETFKNEEFEAKLDKAFGDDSLQRILNEYDAVPEAENESRPSGQ